MTRIPRLRLLLAAVATIAILAPACSGDDDDEAPAPTSTEAANTGGGNADDGPASHSYVEITDVRARETINEKGAVYFTVRSTDEADRLLSASVDPSIAGDVQIHEMVMQGNSVAMQEVEFLDVPAGGELVLKPGSYHVMLLQVQQKLSAGDTFTIDVVFEHSGTITLEVPVMALQGAMGGHG